MNGDLHVAVKHQLNVYDTEWRYYLAFNCMKHASVLGRVVQFGRAATIASLCSVVSRLCVLLKDVLYILRKNFGYLHYIKMINFLCFLHMHYVDSIVV